MAYLNKIDINGRTYYLQHLTDGKYEARLPALTRNEELLLQSQVINSVTSTESKNGWKVPLSAAQGYSLNAKLNQEIIDRGADIDEEQARAEAAEKVLTDNLAQEIIDRTNAVTTEQNRATAKENEISANLTSEINRAKAAEQTNTAAIASEQSRAEGVEANHESRIVTMETFFKEADIDASKEFIDTLKEIQTYIAEDKTGAAAMAASIQENKTEIAKKLDKTDAYVHPSHAAHASDLYKITVDKFGHVSNVASVSKEDIVGLGIPAKDTTYGIATDNSNGLLSAEDKQKYDEYDGRISAIIGTFEEPVDYIVEQGNSKSWTYRKWSSGVAECWGTLSGTLAPTENDSGIAGLSVFSGSVAFPTDLFVDIPSVTYNCRIGDGYSFPADAETSTITHFNWTALTTVTSGNVECKIAAKAFGVWK